ncbi:hypothetical protein AO398_25505 [Methylobacterium sp. GXS13]|uniref:photosynthetic reaction center subunit H n=1 Tax=Methylobacterium sp. GXS13 TaxID=1730094 RepID=UPI00071B1177|nr:photosynthetic reaction center subunit H [Methylobacterium sp. GXS13]KST57267.1 hypothetical protein AO398_25505 [Methylobacterium sp. GXS13]
MNDGVSQIAGQAAHAAGHGIDPATGMVGSTTASEAVGAWGFHLGAITHNLDGVVVLFWAFALFFGTLVWYLRAEDKREGYPMEDPTQPERAHPLVGFPPAPPPKTYTLMKGGTATMPHHDSPPEVPGRHLHPFPGSAWMPTGANPMRDPIGPAAYALREDEPLLQEGERLQLVPLRDVGEEWHVQGGDSDPVGMPVVGRDDAVAGHVRDLWVDRGTKLLRYLEIELTGGGRRLMPIFYANVSPKFRRVKTRSIFGEQFAAAPELRHPDRITAREEDQICAYFAGGKMFADGVRRGRYGQSPMQNPRRGGDAHGLKRLFFRRSA